MSEKRPMLNIPVQNLFSTIAKVSHNISFGLLHGGIITVVFDNLVSVVPELRAGSNLRRYSTAIMQIPRAKYVASSLPPEEARALASRGCKLSCCRSLKFTRISTPPALGNVLYLPVFLLIISASKPPRVTPAARCPEPVFWFPHATILAMLCSILSVEGPAHLILLTRGSANNPNIDATGWAVLQHNFQPLSTSIESAFPCRTKDIRQQKQFNPGCTQILLYTLIQSNRVLLKLQA